jgi:Protein of unknown function (DUF3592)
MTPQYIASGLVPLVAGGAIAASQGTLVYRGMRSQQWPRATGRILSVRADHFLGPGRGEDAWTPDIHYEYTVDNKQFTGNMVLFGGFSWRSTRNLVAAYKPGQHVTVSYDPSTPSRAVLQPGVHIAQVIYSTIGLAAFAIGALTEYVSLT